MSYKKSAVPYFEIWSMSPWGAGIHYDATVLKYKTSRLIQNIIMNINHYCPKRWCNAHRAIIVSKNGNSVASVAFNIPCSQN